jgi:acetyl/propionyl-CoA carboxylase alpha subunit
MGAAKRNKVRAIVGDHTFDLEFGDAHVLANGAKRNFTAAGLPNSRISLIIDGRSVSAVVYRTRPGSYVVHIGNDEFEVALKGEKDILLERFGFAEAGESSLQQIRAPMPGLVLSLRVGEGQMVKAGEALLVLEAMKMENELRAENDGTVKSVHVAHGDAVGKNDLLVEIEA